MIKISIPEVYGWKPAVSGMRNPLNSWGKSDSKFLTQDPETGWVGYINILGEDAIAENDDYPADPIIGTNDWDLMKRLRDGGTEHRKFMRMITVYVDIYAPLYWWKEFDTYKIGTVVNSCSTMHKLTAKEFELDDFSHEHLIDTCLLEKVVNELNVYRDIYLDYDKQTEEYKSEFSKKDIWWQMIQLLPSSYNQKRTIMLNYETLTNIYHQRKNHKLDEWHVFCDWIENELPYSELITGKNWSVDYG